MPVADASNPTGMTSQRDVKRSRGEDPYPLPCHRRNAVPDYYKDVDGWGADLDPADRPMSQRELPSDVETVRGEVEHRQTPTHPVFVSNEMPDLTPVFGTSCPPHGLSGRMRRLAFEYGEGTGRHWVTLLAADRVDMIESTLGALFRGAPDNIPAEKGWLMRLSGGSPMKRRLIVAAGAVTIFMMRRLLPPASPLTRATRSLRRAW